MVSDSPTLPPCLIVTGPTAAGKTGVALALADRFEVELISVDSAQIYRGLDVGAAKPDAETLARYPHRLIDIRDPEDAYSVAEFMTDAEAAIRKAHTAGRMPLLVGGTVLYLRALLYGIDAMPGADPAVRSRIAAEAERRGWQALHDELAERDPVAAAAMAPADAQRIQRALEILELTGRPPSSLRRHNRVPRLDSLRLVLTPANRHILHDRIARRFDRMLAEGLVEEVAELRCRAGLRADTPAMRSVGYRQIWQYLDGAGDLDEAAQRAVSATRQLAKRQLTALRQLTRGLWHDPGRERTIDLIFRQVGDFFQWVDKQGKT